MLDKPSGVDPSTIKIELPQTEFQKDQEDSDKEGRSRSRRPTSAPARRNKKTPPKRGFL
jgi:hypothetical protein